MTDIIERLRAAVPTCEGTPIAWPCEVRSELLLEAAAEVERLRAALRWYADLSNHLPVECRDPGDPDPAVVVLDEPPILRDNGTLARAALEAKP